MIQLKTVQARAWARVRPRPPSPYEPYGIVETRSKAGDARRSRREVSKGKACEVAIVTKEKRAGERQLEPTTIPYPQQSHSFQAKTSRCSQFGEGHGQHSSSSLIIVSLL